MNTQQTLPVDEAIQLLAASYNQEVIQHDEQCELLDQKDAEIQKLKEENKFISLQVESLKRQLNEVMAERDEAVSILKTHEKAAEKLLEEAKKTDQKVKHAQQLEQQAKVQLDAVNAKMADYKALGTPKKIREKFKNYQDKAAKHLATEKQHKIEISKYRHAIKKAEDEVKEIHTRLREVDITEVYNHNGDHLWMFPKVTQLVSRGMDQKEIAFLYLNNDGRGALMTLDEDGEISMGTAPKGGLRPSAQTKAHASMLLNKFKKNNWTVQVDDLAIIDKVAA